MNLIDSIRLVLKNMLEKKGRVMLTISGIIIGIFTFTFFIFVSQGLENAISEQFGAFGLNVLGVQPAGQGQGEPGGKGLTDTHVEKIKQVVRNYNYIAPGIFFRTQFEYGRERTSTLSLAYPNDLLNDVQKDMGIEMYEGRSLRVRDSSVVIVGYKFAKESFDRELNVGNSLKVDDRSFRIIGIMQEQGDLFVDNAVMMSFDDIKEVSDQDTYSVIRVSLPEGADLEYYKSTIERKLNPNNKEKVVEVTSPSDIIDQFNQIIGLLTAIISFVSSIALIVGGINVMNTMYSNVLERVNEISVMKALGGTNSDIRNLFLIESSVLGLVGALIGFVMAYGLAELASYLITFTGYNVPIYFSAPIFFSIILITTFFATLFGTWPAIKAAHVNPADNLRDE